MREDGSAFEGVIEAESLIGVGNQGFGIGQPFVKVASFQTTVDFFTASQYGNLAMAPACVRQLRRGVILPFRDPTQSFWHICIFREFLLFRYLVRGGSGVTPPQVE